MLTYEYEFQASGPPIAECECAARLAVGDSARSSGTLAGASFACLAATSSSRHAIRGIECLVMAGPTRPPLGTWFDSLRSLTTRRRKHLPAGRQAPLGGGVTPRGAPKNTRGFPPDVRDFFADFLKIPIKIANLYIRHS